VSQTLFKSGKIGCFVDTYSPAIEKRRGEETSVLTLRLRVQPFDAKLATLLDDGVGDTSNIKATVFNLSTAEPKPNFTRHDFRLGLVRQNLHIFASPDTEDARVMLPQAKISGTFVRSQKDNNALALIFKASFGPVGRDELELIHSLHRSQTFIRFEESEPLFEVEDDGADDGTDADQKAQQPINVRQPMFNDSPDHAPAPRRAKPATGRINRPLHSHQSKRKTAAKGKGRRK
jgi:hypothetical protein